MFHTSDRPIAVGDNLVLLYCPTWYVILLRSSWRPVQLSRHGSSILKDIMSIWGNISTCPVPLVHPQPNVISGDRSGFQAVERRSLQYRPTTKAKSSSSQSASMPGHSRVTALHMGIPAPSRPLDATESSQSVDHDSDYSQLKKKTKVAAL